MAAEEAVEVAVPGAILLILEKIETLNVTIRVILIGMVVNEEDLALLEEMIEMADFQGIEMRSQANDVS